MTVWESVLQVITGKTCKCCGLSKPVTIEFWYFHKQHKKRAGLTTMVPNPNCRECTKAIAKDRYLDKRDEILSGWRKDRRENPQKYAAYDRKQRERNPDKIKARNKASYESNKEARKAYERNKRLIDGDRVRAMDNARRRADPEKFREQNRARAAKNREDIAAKARAYRAANPDKFREYEKRRYNFDRRISSTVTAKMIKMLREKGCAKKDTRRMITGWSLNDLLHHLSPLLEVGMTFDNWGEWQIDHVIPVSLVEFADESDQSFKDVWSLGNLAPLWAFDNNSKHNRLDWELPSKYKNPLLRQIYENPPMKHLVEGFNGFKLCEELL